MLIDTSYRAGDTVSLKLSSGEEVIARLDQEGADSVTLVKPLMLTATQQGLGLAPFMFTISPDAKIKINNSNITCITKTEGEMAKQYISNTTGIETI